MVLPALILWGSLAVDRIFGDPQNSFHPTAYIGRFIGWWGRPGLYPKWLQRSAGALLTLLTAGGYALLFFLFEHTAPAILLVLGGSVLLKLCFAWRCLEEHVGAVGSAIQADNTKGRAEAQMLVSRDTSVLSGEQVLSAAYESMTENLVDSIVSPLFYFTIFGLAGAAFFRAVNTIDAMLGYTDERVRIGWFPARLDDLLNFIPARLTGLLLLGYFALKGRFTPAYRVFLRDAKKRPGFNGGIPMAIMAGGAGICFEKPGAYRIGDGARTLAEAGPDLVEAVRVVTLISAICFTATLYVIVILGQ
jgi:adenosylcobinamide-phosphate synthase